MTNNVNCLFGTCVCPRCEEEIIEKSLKLIKANQVAINEIGKNLKQLCERFDQDRRLKKEILNEFYLFLKEDRNKS